MTPKISVPFLRRTLLRTPRFPSPDLSHHTSKINKTLSASRNSTVVQHTKSQPSGNSRNMSSHVTSDTLAKIESDVEDSETIKRIRRRLGSPGVSHWGFVIVRCTYSSQPRWEEYIRRIQHHIKAELEEARSADLLSKLDIPILEDEKLEGATWKQARDRFDEWLIDQVMKNDASTKTKEEARKVFVSSRAPRYEFCIFADEASLESVVGQGDYDSDMLDIHDKIKRPGSYYFTVVATGLDDPREFTELDDGTVWKDREDVIETRRALYQKFKANEFVGLYAACDASGWEWPDTFRHDGGGVSRCY